MVLARKLLDKTESKVAHPAGFQALDAGLDAKLEQGRRKVPVMEAMVGGRLCPRDDLNQMRKVLLGILRTRKASSGLDRIKRPAHARRLR